MTPHPQRCETCDNCLIIKERGRILKRCKFRPNEFLLSSVFRSMGCASHSAAKSEQEKVLAKLEKVIDRGIDALQESSFDGFVSGVVAEKIEVLHWVKTELRKQGEPR